MTTDALTKLRGTLNELAELSLVHNQVDATLAKQLADGFAEVVRQAKSLALVDLECGAAEAHSLAASPEIEKTATDRVQAILRYLQDLASQASTPDECSPDPTPQENAHGEVHYAERGAWADDPELMGEFLGESAEHLEAADNWLLKLEEDHSQPDALDALFRAFHSIKGLAGFLELDQIGKVVHAGETLLDKARKGELQLKGPLLDITFDTVDIVRKLVALVEAAFNAGTGLALDPGVEPLVQRLEAAASGELAERVGDILVEAGAATRKDVEAAAHTQSLHPNGPPLGQVLVQEGVASPKEVGRALRRQQELNDATANPEPQQGQVARRAIKVDAERLGTLVDTIGELAIAQSMVQETSRLAAKDHPKLAARLNRMAQITRDLHSMAGNLRLVPLARTFKQMARVVRDVARATGRQAELVMRGEQTELDKTLVDAIGDPLMHMVRNAVDHGLESSAEERRAAGKPEVGRVELRAFHRAGGICIEIADDGRGIDPQKILRKAQSRGLVAEDAELSDREIYNLIFAAGFSTAEKVTGISGRGVGMDVVRRSVEALSGTLDIDSALGRGTTFSMRLPLTLAVMDGMVLRVGGERYIIPVSAIVRSVRPRTDDISTVFSRGELVTVGGGEHPVGKTSPTLQPRWNHRPHSRFRGCSRNGEPRANSTVGRRDSRTTASGD